MDDRLEEEPVLLGVGDGCCLARAFADRADRMKIDRDPHPCVAGQRVAQRADREAVAQQEVVRRRRRERIVAVAGGMRADAIALVGDLERLVERDPQRVGVAQRRGR